MWQRRETEWGMSGAVRERREGRTMAGDREVLSALEQAEREYWLQPGAYHRPDSGPQAAGAAWRVVGPGRRERAYQVRVAQLETELQWAARIERGAQKLLDRLDARHAEDQLQLAAGAQREKRLILALGALHKENELLQRRVALLEQGSKAESAAPRSRGWRDWFGRGRRPGPAQRGRA
jgi:hypothetical protein